jgi:hypothetical protein
LKDLRLKYKNQANQNSLNLTNEEANRQLEDNFDLQEDIIGLRKKYKNEFLKVISAAQLVTLFNAEKDFRMMLMKELQNRRDRNDNPPMRGGGGRRMYRY